MKLSSFQSNKPTAIQLLIGTIALLVSQQPTTTTTNAFSPSQLNNRLRSSTNSYYTYDTTTTKNSNRATLLILAATKIGIFFGTSTGNTENVADLIAAEFAAAAEDADADIEVDGPIEIDELQGSLATKFHEYDALVVGTPTWNTGADSERSGTGWDEVYYGEMQDLALDGKNVAVFGLGDQISYAENYADASGELHDVFENLGCKMFGYTSQEGYEHEASKAIRGDKFCGLLCDEVNQDDLSEERVENWVSQLKAEGFMDGGGAGSVAGSTPSDVVVETKAVAVPVSSSSSSDATTIEDLEKENAELRMMLEENSKLMDEVMQSQGNNLGFTPHFNAKTKVTMWTSADGRKCYYTTDNPQNP